MLRIDDNTYIDATLITCAEYQLFLDDMRAHGKYYQPDHWAGYQFPAGQAHKPLLGMRPSDGLAFCEWLTARAQGDWGFRLPTPDEAAAYPLPVEAAEGLGYWVYMPATKHKEFVWTSASRPKVLSQKSLQTKMARDAAFAPSSIRTRDLARAIDRVLARDLGLDRALDLDRDRALDIDSVLALGFDFGTGIIRALDLDRARNRALDRVSDRNNARAIVLSIALAHSRSLDVYIDLLILEERLRGRLLPFEGIRIVKERKQEKS